MKKIDILDFKMQKDLDRYFTKSNVNIANNM